jgi:hypothetical protein
MTTRSVAWILSLTLAIIAPAGGTSRLTAGTQQQIADPDFKPSVSKPAYVQTHPLIVVDEAHANFHTASGRYKPFADLLTADGYRVVAGTDPFAVDRLRDARVLVISNARGAGLTAENAADPPSAFSEAECDSVRDWVRAGGSLLLIADHSPFGATAALLASRFGVEMGKGYAWSVSKAAAEPTTQIEYTADTGLLVGHSITRGVTRVVAFTGQSLSVPPAAVALLTFGSTSYESTAANAQSDMAAFREGKKTTARAIGGRAQALALEYGKGRVVMVGEAAMFSAQVGSFPDEKGQTVKFKMGMNVEGNENAQFLLNIMHWLTRLERD